MVVRVSQKLPLRVALYAGVSAVGGLDARLRLDELRTAAQQRGWRVVEELSDVGAPNAKDRRPELHRLMQLVQRGMVDIVAVRRLDEFVRSNRHLAAVLEEYEMHGVDFFSVQEGIDTTGAIPTSGSVAESELDAGLERASAESAARSCRRGVGGWPRAVRELARARRLQVRSEHASQLQEPRSEELSEADKLRALSRYVSLCFRDGRLVFPGLAFGPIVRGSDPEELAEETNIAIIEATREQDPS